MKINKYRKTTKILKISSVVLALALAALWMAPGGFGLLGAITGGNSQAAAAAAASAAAAAASGNGTMVASAATAATAGSAASARAPGPFGSVGPRANDREDPAGGIYVSPDGNDATADGSTGKPYKSINTALANAKPGDTIVLRGGTYREGVNVRVRLPNITIKSAKGEWAVIDLTTYNAGADEDSGVYFDVDASGGKLQNVEVMGGFYAVCTETKWNWGGEDDWVAACDIIIEDCKLHDSRYDTVKVKPNCDNVTIRYNEIYNSGQAFAGHAFNGEDNAEGIDNVNGDKMKVYNNYIHDICSNAIYAKGGAADVLIENNVIRKAYGAGIMIGFDTSPDFFDLTVNPQYYENIRGVVRNNLIIDIGWEGIGLYAAKDAQAYNNTLVNVANGEIYRSAIYFGLTYQDWDDKAKRPPSVNPKIHHNIVSQPSSFSRPVIEIRYMDELGGMSALDGNPSMGDNCYYVAGKKAAFTDNRPGRKLDNADLSGWQKHISGDVSTIEADPALDSAYMPANPLCAGMGISSSLSTDAGAGAGAAAGGTGGTGGTGGETATGNTGSTDRGTAGQGGTSVSGSAVTVTVTIGDEYITRNGVKIKIDENNFVAPYISGEGRTMVPLRAISESLGAAVGWLPESQTVTISLGDTAIELIIGEPLPDGLGMATLSPEGRTFVPLRYVAEALDATVEWEPVTQTVTVVK